MVRDRGGSSPGERPGLQAGLWLPIFDELADPRAVAGLAAEAEQAGWHGVFARYHLRWREPVRQVADPWITPQSTAATSPSSRRTVS